MAVKNYEDTHLSELGLSLKPIFYNNHEVLYEFETLSLFEWLTAPYKYHVQGPVFQRRNVA